MKEFKYKTDPFISNAKVIHPKDDSLDLALASLNSLKGLIPENIDFDANPDAIFNSFNAAVCSRANKNDDLISNEDGLKIYKNFIYKFCDVEHRRDIIVGSIINAGFSSFGENALLTEEEVKNTKDPVNICLASVVWRVLNEQFAEMLVSSSDETSILHNSISASWELGFDNYQILLGHKDLSQGELITDEVQVAEFSKFLRANKGEGKTKDGVPVYRKIVGDMYPLAIGYVKRPAAEVEGVLIVDTDAPVIVEAKEREIIEINSLDKLKEIAAADHHIDKCSCGEVISQCRCNASDKKINIIENGCNKCKESIANIKNISSENKNSVNKDTKLSIKEKIVPKHKNNMKLKFKDLNKETIETVASADVYELAIDLNKSMTEYAEKLDAKEQEAKAAQEKFDKVKADHDSVAAELEKIKLDLQKINEVRAAEKIQNDFNVRMADLNEKFELDANKSKSIAAQIRGLDDASFATWLESFQPFLVAKKFVPFFKKEDDEDDDDKDKDKDKEDKKKESSASLLDEIKNLQPETKTIVNKTASTKSISELVAEAFKGVGEE